MGSTYKNYELTLKFLCYVRYTFKKLQHGVHLQNCDTWGLLSETVVHGANLFNYNYNWSTLLEFVARGTHLQKLRQLEFHQKAAGIPKVSQMLAFANPYFIRLLEVLTFSSPKISTKKLEISEKKKKIEIPIRNSLKEPDPKLVHELFVVKPLCQVSMLSYQNNGSNIVDSFEYSLYSFQKKQPGSFTICLNNLIN